MPIKALPNELWIYIFKLTCVDGDCTGRSLAAVSRYMREILYAVRLQSIAMRSVNDVLAFHRAFVRGREPNEQVKNLFISIDNQDYWTARKRINAVIRERYELSEPSASSSPLWKRVIQRIRSPARRIYRRNNIYFRDFTHEQRISFLRQSILDILHYTRPGLVSLTISIDDSLFHIVLPGSLPALQFLSVNAEIITHNITPKTFPALTCLDLNRYVDLPKVLSCTSSLEYLRLSSSVFFFTLFSTQLFSPHNGLEEPQRPLLTQLGKYADLQRIVFVLNESYDWIAVNSLIDDMEPNTPPTSDIVNNQALLQDSSEVGSSTEQDHLIMFCSRSQGKDLPRELQLREEWVECNENGRPCWIDWQGMPWVLPTSSGPMQD